MSAIVHHGGSGTTGLALRSGVPSLVIPFGADQPFWGRRTQVLGVGVESIPVRQLHVQNLIESIRQLTSDAGMRERAAFLGAALHKEDGINEAISVIQRVVGL